MYKSFAVFLLGLFAKHLVLWHIDLRETCGQAPEDTSRQCRNFQLSPEHLMFSMKCPSACHFPPRSFCTMQRAARDPLLGWLALQALASRASSSAGFLRHGLESVSVDLRFPGVLLQARAQQPLLSHLPRDLRTDPPMGKITSASISKCPPPWRISVSSPV